MDGVIQEPFALTKGESGITAQDGLDNSTNFGEIFQFQVPVGVGLVILPAHVFSIYLYGDDSAEMPATTLVKVIIKDASKQESKTILGPTLYQTLKEFTDKDKLAHFDVPEPVKVYENQFLCIETAGADAAGTAGVDVTGGTNESYFEAGIARVRHPL